MSGSAPGGYVVHHGLFRVPDLLTEQQFVDYMLSVYGVKVTMTYVDAKGDELAEENVPTAARALGQSFNIAPAIALDGRAGGELDADAARSLLSGVDPVLRQINERSVPASYDTEPIGNVPREDDDRVERVEVVDKDENVDADDLRDTADLGDLEGGEDGDADGDAYTEDGDVVTEDDPSDLDTGTDEELTVRNYNSMKVDELRSELIDRKLNSTGNKDELAARLEESDRA